MTATVHIHIGTHTAWLVGDGHILHPAIRRRSPKRWDAHRRAIMMPAKYVDDVLAVLELQGGVGVQVEREKL